MKIIIIIFKAHSGKNSVKTETIISCTHVQKSFPLNPFILQVVFEAKFSKQETSPLSIFFSCDYSTKLQLLV